MNDSTNRGHRILVAVVAATVASSLFGGLHYASAEVSSGERAVFVPIVPCRLFDTRAEAPVGPRTVPLGPGETVTQQVRGNNGNCSIPPDATAVAMNVTVVHPNARSYLTLWPADAARPLASNLNWTADDESVPNKVDVKLSADGHVNLYNHAGQVNVLADVVGYYADHTHDDRYYLKAEIDEALAATVSLPTGTTTELLDSAAFIPSKISTTGNNIEHESSGFITGTQASPGACAHVDVRLPDGVTVTSISARVYDLDATQHVTFTLYRNPSGSSPATPLAIASTGADPALPGNASITDATINAPVIDPVNSYFATVCGMVVFKTAFFDASITYTFP